MELFQVKRYYDCCMKRNKIYYYLLSLYVASENPLKVRNLNKQLKEFHQIVLEEKEKLNQFSHKVLVMFENVETRKEVHRRYKLGLLTKWGYGVQALLNQFGIRKFEN